MDSTRPGKGPSKYPVHLSFDEQAAAYDRWFATSLGHLTDAVEMQAIFGLMPDVLGQHILEIGCGTGSFSLALANRGAQVVGFDCSEPMLAKAQSKFRSQKSALFLVKGLASYLPFTDESFDGVVCLLALDFMTERETVLREMTRVLRPGGFLSVGILNRFSLWTAKRLIKAWFKPSLWREVRFMTARELWRLLAGQPELANIRMRRAVYFPPWGNRYFMPYYNKLEKLGARLNLPTGAFLAAAATKRIKK